MIALLTTDAVEFTGRLHPAVLHLPFGLLVALLLAELGSVRRGAGPLVRWLWVVTALSAAVAATSGWMLQASGEYSGRELTVHMWGGIGLAGFLVAGALLAMIRRLGWMRWLILLGALAGVSVIGHYGGVLTRGPKYISSVAPEWMRESIEAMDRMFGIGQPVEPPKPEPDQQSPEGPAAEVPESGVPEDGEPDGAVVPEVVSQVASDQAVVLALLEKRCVRCHGPRKQKGKLRLDQADGLSSVVEAGSPADSELFRRMTLPAGHDDAMPPKGDRISEEQLLALTRWIQSGAPMDELGGELERAATERNGEAASLERLRQATGAVIVAVGESDSGPLRVDFARRESALDAAALEAWKSVADRTVELSFAGVTFAALLGEVPALPVLERLHLERSDVGDAEVARFAAQAPGLRYLNLHSTRVTEASAETFAKMDSLERLVLFGTSFDGAAIERLKEALPRVEITAALSLPDRPFDRDGPRRILAADASVGRIALLQETSIGVRDTVWEHAIEQIHDLQLLPDGRILFQDTWTRLLEVDPETGEVAWQYDAAVQNRTPEDGPVEVHSFRRLANGNTLIAESGAGRLIEVAPGGDLVRTVPLTRRVPDPHHDTRLVRVTEAGTYLVAHEGDGFVREYDAQGEVVWSYDAAGAPVFAAERLPDGNTLVTLGDRHRVVEVDPAGQVVWELASDDVRGVELAWLTTVQVLASGNLVLGNCHAGPEQPQLLEVTRDGEVVWQMRDFERFGNALSNSYVIEDPLR